MAPAFQNGWVNYGFDGTNDYVVAGYAKDQFGRVYLRGLIKNGAIPSTVFTLPAGYRPPKRTVFVVLSNGAVGRVDVLADGQVRVEQGQPAWLSLDGIHFRAA